MLIVLWAQILPLICTNQTGKKYLSVTELTFKVLVCFVALKRIT